MNATPSAGTGVPAGMMVPADFVKNYNLKPIENQGAKGQGETIGIITFAAIDPSTPVKFWNNVLGLGVNAEPPEDHPDRRWFARTKPGCRFRRI